MIYSFKETLLNENNRGFFKIPFNVWETCRKKGLVPVEVEVLGRVYECRLVPKGNGMYYIPVPKKVCSNIDFSEEINVQFKVIDKLSRINSNSPYIKEKPIRSIDSIIYLKQPQSGLCGQTCIAMLAGISIDEAIMVMKSTRWQASMTKVIETLDYFGFSFEKPIYTKGRNVNLPKCCIVNVRGDNKSHFVIYFDGIYYDPTCGILQDYNFEDIICYMEIDASNDRERVCP